MTMAADPSSAASHPQDDNLTQRSTAALPLHHQDPSSIEMTVLTTTTTTQTQTTNHHSDDDDDDAEAVASEEELLRSPLIAAVKATVAAATSAIGQSIHGVDGAGDNNDKEKGGGTAYKDDGHGGGAPGSASNPQVIVNIIISFVGAGLLGVPNAFSKAGWFLGSVTLIAVSALNLYAMLLLPQVKRKLNERGHADIASYGDLGRVLLGSRGEMLVNVCLGISQAGFATAYIIFIAANMYSLARIPRLLVCILCVPGLAFLVSLQEMKQLAPFSLLANGANFAALSAVLFQDYETYERGHKNMDALEAFDKYGPDDYAQHTTSSSIRAVRWSGFLYVIAITIYSMEGVGLILSLEASAKQPHMFASLLKGTVACITLFMAFFGTAGYMAFGDATLAPITLNLQGHFSGTFVKFALCLGLYLTYPIMMFPIWSVAERLYPVMKENLALNKRFRIAVVSLSALVAYAVPDFGKFLSLVGSSICTILGFILPCAFHWLTYKDEMPEWQYRLDMFLIVGGSLFGICGTIESFMAMMHGELEGEVRRLQERQDLYRAFAENSL